MSSAADRGSTRDLTEQHTIEYIPPSERHGTARSLFAVWFVPNIAVTVVVVGVIIASLGQSLGWTIASIIVGSAVGTLFMAYHSAQGPTMGVPQMIQSRAQFGVVGATLPLLVAVAIELGYYAVLAVLCGQALAAIFGFSVTIGIVIGSVAMLAITIIGYDLLHRYSRVVSWLTVAAFGYLCVNVLTTHTPAVQHPGNSVGIFLLAVSIAASAGLTWAPFVADYSRYLPKSTSRSATFWYTYLGCTFGLIIAMVLGAIIALQSKNAAADPVTYLGHISGHGVSWLVLGVIALGLIQANVLDLYSASMSAVTLVDAFGRLKSQQIARIVRWSVAMVGCFAMTLVAIFASSNFLLSFQNYLLLILYVIIPWTAINLVDFYFVRRGQYSTRDLYDANGIYGRVNWVAIAIYAIAVGVQVPFVNTPLYAGPLVHAVGGGDIAWLVGLAVAGGAYYIACLVQQPSIEPSAETRVAAGEA